MTIQSRDRVLITGGTGSLGHALVAYLQKVDPTVTIRVLARDEKKQYEMAKTFPDVEYVLGDVRDPAVCRDAVKDINVVIHGASLKYVNVSELQPREYVTTNVMGTINLVDAVLQSGVRRFTGISTDKACLPINTYGMTKALLEKIVLEAQTRQGSHQQCSFTVARYGNVVGTRGSVVPFWQERREEGLTLPVTNPDMTRFFFTIDEAVDLVMNFALVVNPGLIVSKRMSACTVGDLANAMRGNSEVEILGERPGEKHNELLLTEAEMSRTNEHGGIFLYDPNAEPFNPEADHFGSDNAPRLSQDELKIMLAEYL